MKYRVQFRESAWTVTAPGGRTWPGLPSHAAAFHLAQSLAAVDSMLAGIAVRAAA